MKVVILNPPGLNNVGFVREGRCEQRTSSFQYVMLPVTLTYLAAILRQKGYEVTLIDAIAEHDKWPAALDKIIKSNPSLVVFNISTGTYYNDLAVIKDMRSSLPSAHFNAIGVHVSATPQESLDESVLDSVSRGEPEYIVLDLTDALRDRKPMSSVMGISFRENGKIVHNGDGRLVENLDELPYPARDMVRNERYTLPVINQPYTLLVPARGCPYPCIFCTAFEYYGKKARFRSVENVIGELKEIVKVHKIHYVTMWSDTFTLNKKFVMKISRGIIEERLDLKWMCNSRVDTIDEEMLDVMARSGCIGISYGIESGDQEILDNVKKGSKVEQIENAIRLTNKYGIESLAHVIFGLTGDTEEKIKKTIKFIIRIKPSYAQFYAAVPFPGTEFYRQAVANNWLTTKNWSEFEINKAIISTHLLTAKRLDRLRRQAYMRFYLNIGYIWGRIVKMKSINEFFKTSSQAVNFIKSWVFGKE